MIMMSLDNNEKEIHLFKEPRKTRRRVERERIPLE